MTENEDETLKWNEWQCDGRKDVIKRDAPKKEENNDGAEMEEWHKKYILRRKHQLKYIFYAIIAIHRMKFYGHRLGGTDNILLVVEFCFRIVLVSLRSLFSPGFPSSASMNMHASHIWSSDAELQICWFNINMDIKDEM